MSLRQTVKVCCPSEIISCKHSFVPLETGSSSSKVVYTKVWISHSHADRGYWTDFGNLQLELQALIKEKGLEPDMLPTNRQLRQLGANQLCNAIEYHGGFSRVAERLKSVLLPACKHLSLACVSFTAASLKSFLQQFCAAVVFNVQGQAMTTNDGSVCICLSNPENLRGVLRLDLLQCQHLHGKREITSL